MKSSIHLIAPSFRFTKNELDNALSNASILGFEVLNSDLSLPACEKFSSNFQTRVKHINSIFKDDSSNLIFSIKGGYGAIELLQYLDYDSFKKHNKKLFGFSDVTSILNAIHMKTNMITFHASNLGSRSTLDEYEINQLKKLLLDQSIIYDIKNKSTQNISKQTYLGKSVGGNLVIMCDMLGSSFQINCDNNIVFLECQGTKGYRIYMKLVQLYLAGVFENCECVVLGHFYKCSFAKKYLTLFFETYPIPVIWWGDFGHNKPNNPFPIGSNTKIDLINGTLFFENK